MPYTHPITLINNTPETLTIVEKTIWHYANGGIWTEHDPDLTLNPHQGLFLTMNGSGTSGMLRVRSSSGEFFTVVVGYHNYEFWCDAQVDLEDGDTAMKVHPEYYGSGRLAGSASGEKGVKREARGGRAVEVRLQRLPCGRPPVVITYS
ncbi:uncharacterized protein DSM5745_07295 [Aspergillus mulundensis]|uniref:Boletus edulis lectin n=1 Tax=Aspergillus mulundensis TaxID=1810919 RepID=A0A3D8RKS7_9EURO|nr:hypothetical protein DSM5745_07295 [Aspergillus mulundensis]RDW74633.1 hypothetical protein DSM5745_07295 [Aspergillus mulundensis]